MNREECLDTLKDMANCWVMESLDIDEASKEADEVIAYFERLVERDEPQETYKDVDGAAFERCSSCRAAICEWHERTEYKDEFCWKCGQRLDRSE